ncbi:MAG: AMP-binding protein [Bacteroidetes bacterium]|nr:AMP-binding protein [Bacteroidota bacterium]
MNHLEYKQLTINGHRLVDEEIIDFCKKSNIQNINKIGDFMAEWLSPKTTLAIQTSGSTGIPKTIIVSKLQMLQSAKATAQFFNFKKNQTALLCLPINYIAGKMMLIRALYSQLNLICIEPSSQPLNNLSADSIIDFVPLTPMQLKGTKQTSNIKTILLGGGPVSAELEQTCKTLSADVYHGYGMTETLSHIALRKINGSNPSLTYQALPGVLCSIDHRQCLQLEVPFLNEKICTNDIVDLINETTFIWKGRLDNIINSGGIKLFPETIETKLSDYIKTAYFIAGLPDNTLGEKLCLFIEDEKHTNERLQNLEHYLEQHLEKYERPKTIYFLPKFIRTKSEKIQRNKTIELLNGI